MVLLLLCCKTSSSMSSSLVLTATELAGLLSIGLRLPRPISIASHSTQKKRRWLSLITSGSHVIAKPRNVASITTVTSFPVIAAKPRNVTSITMVTSPTIDKPRNETCTTTVMPTPTVSFMSASPDVKVTNDLEIKAVDSPLVNQIPNTWLCTCWATRCFAQLLLLHWPRHIWHPIWRQDLLPFAWYGPSCFALREVCSLAKDPGQHAHQDFKKEPVDSFAIKLNPQYLTIPCPLQWLDSDTFIDNQVQWPNCNLNNQYVYHKFSFSNYNCMMVMSKMHHNSALISILGQIPTTLSHTIGFFQGCKFTDNDHLSSPLVGGISYCQWLRHVTYSKWSCC